MTDIVQFYIQSVYGLFCVRAFRTRHISHILYFCFKRVFFLGLKNISTVIKIKGMQETADIL